MSGKISKKISDRTNHCAPSLSIYEASPRMPRHIRDFYWAAGAKFENSSGKYAPDNRKKWPKRSRRSCVLPNYS